MKELGERILLARKKSKIARADLGVLLGVKDGAVGKYERGASDPGIEGIQTIAHACDVDLHWLITGKDHQVTYATEAMGNGTINESSHVDLKLIKQVIEAVEDHLQNNNLTMSPEKIAELVEVLYEEISESNDKQINKGTVARMIKLAT